LASEIDSIHYVTLSSLGAGDDGVSDNSSSGCADHNYIMTAFSGTADYLTNRFLFSCCSQRSFYATI